MGYGYAIFANMEEARAVLEAQLSSKGGLKFQIGSSNKKLTLTFSEYQEKDFR